MQAMTYCCERCRRNTELSTAARSMSTSASPASTWFHTPFFLTGASVQTTSSDRSPLPTLS